MYKVIIVDDESDIRKRLVYLMEQINLGFEVVADYENGIDAYEGISSNIPDLLITDIKIPYIDGIELVEKLKRIAPLLRVIIITGYDQFDHVKSAIDLGVVSFITKPITKDELQESLLKIKESLEKEYYLLNNLNELKKFQNDNIQLIRENDLCRLVSKSNLSSNFIKKLSVNGITLDFNYIILAIIDFDVDSDIINPDKYDLIFISIKQMIMNIKIDDISFDVFTRNDKLLILIKTNRKIENSEIEKMFEAIVFKVNRMSKYSLSIGFSNISYGKHNFKRIHENAKRALEYRSVIGGNQVLFYDNLIKSKLNINTIEDDELKGLIYTINYKSLAEVEEYMKGFLVNLFGDDYNLNYQHVFFSILNAMIKACDNVEVLSERFYSNKDFYAILIESKTIDNIREFFVNLAKNIKTINEDNKLTGMESSFQEIVDYIESHYNDFDLNLDLLAEEVGLSISYICALFKKNLNTTFVKYLTSIRMKKAVKLLKERSLKIIDIAEAIGFNDAYYFSHCFKKYYGLSPKEYRSNE